MNIKFYKLPIEKQTRIINAGYKVFSLYPYKKAPMSVIAEEADISKPLLFHYFKNKKGLYIFLFETAVEYTKSKTQDESILQETDYFNIIGDVIKHRILVMSKYPYIIRFLKNAYYEQNDIVKCELSALKDKMISVRKNELLSSIDSKKFKHPEDISALFDIILWMSEGYMLNYSDAFFTESDKISIESNNLIETLRRNFYKDEYL